MEINIDKNCSNWIGIRPGISGEQKLISFATQTNGYVVHTVTDNHKFLLYESALFRDLTISEDTYLAVFDSGSVIRCYLHRLFSAGGVQSDISPTIRYVPIELEEGDYIQVIKTSSNWAYGRVFGFECPTGA